MIVILHKIAYRINSSLLGVVRYPIFKSFRISNMFSYCISNFNGYSHSFFFYSYLNPYKQSDWINL